MDLNPAPGRRVVVVGGGIAGLSAAWRLKLLRPDLSVSVVEALARFGGKLITEHRDGFLLEGAADGFLARKPPALGWVQALGLGSELVEPRAEHRSSQVLWGGQLHKMPEGFSGLVPGDPQGLLTSTFLSADGAAQASAEPSVPFRTDGAEESVGQFFRRRFGPEAFERLLEPLLAGIFAGDADVLSADGAFPQLTALERAGRSLMTGPGPGTPVAAGPAFRSFSGGMARLPAALEEALRNLGVTLEAGCPVTGIGRAGAGFEVRTSRQSFGADVVLMALGPRVAGALLRGVSPGLSEILSGWPTASVAHLNLAFDASELTGLPPGSGFVAPRASGTPFSAATWASRKWPGRAPQGKFLVRFYFGGARDPLGWKASETDMTGAALDFLGSVTGGPRPKPLWGRVYRWADAFAQPDLGHAGRHRALEAAAVPGLVLAGAYFAGVGIPDTLARSETAAQTIAQFLPIGDNTP